MQWRGLGVRTHHVHFKIVRRGGAGRNHGAQRRAISERIDKPRLGEEESGTVRFQAWRGPDRSPRVSGLDSDTPMRSLIRNERRINRYRSCPHERSGCQGMGQKTRTSRRSRFALGITGRIWTLIIFWVRRSFRMSMGLTLTTSCFDCRVDSGGNTRLIPHCSSGRGGVTGGRDRDSSRERRLAADCCAPSGPISLSSGHCFPDDGGVGMTTR
jgi:hypothetical protein